MLLFQDTCKDGPACNAVDIYQGKEPNLEFVKLKTPKDEEAETKPGKPHPPQRSSPKRRCYCPLDFRHSEASDSHSA